MRKYNKIAMIMCSFGLFLILTGVTYSFFNYTKTGLANNFNVGNISFTTQNEQTITLNNLFPIDPTEQGIMNDSTKVGTYQISISGNTDYAKGLEYLVSVVDTHLTTSTDKTIPISLNVTANNLGTSEDDYFVEREDKDRTIYKSLVNDAITGDQMIMVGYIKPNTTVGTAEGVNGSITIKAYLDKSKIAISDTYTEPTPTPTLTPTPTPQSSGTYVLNPNMTPQIINDCVDYLTNTMGFPGTTEVVTSYCQGETTAYGTITNDFSLFPASAQEYLIEHNVFIDPNDGNNTPSNSGTNGTTFEWVNGRVVLTTSEWDSISSTGVSFKIKVEANEGIWVEEPLSRNDMDHLMNVFTSSANHTAPYDGRKSSITEINFVRMSEESINAHQDAIDVTRENGEGMVKLWIDGTVLYIASPGKTYLPSGSSGLLMNFTNVTRINFGNIDTSEVTEMPGFFQNDSSLTNIDLHKFDTSHVTNMSAMFMGCTGLTDIDLSYLDTSSILYMSGMFNGCTSLETANVSGLGGDDLINAYMFYGVGSTTLRSVNLSNFNFGNMSGLSGMFNSSDFVNTEEIILRNAKTSNVTSMNAAFANVYHVKTIDLRGIDTSHVTDMTAMFNDCADLENILGLDEFDTSSVTEMAAMFHGTLSLTSINLSNFNTSNVTTMAGMFANNSGLTNLNITSFNTNSLTNMTGMFFGDTGLTTIDLSSFNTSNVTDMSLLFAMAEMGNNSNLTPINNSLTTIKVGNNWSTSNVTTDTNMFYNCTHIVGGSGTVFDSNYINKTYAHVDGGSTNPGYLTLKTS